MPTRLQGTTATAATCTTSACSAPTAGRSTWTRWAAWWPTPSRAVWDGQAESGLAQPAGADRRALVAAGGDPARIPAVPPGAGRRLHQALQERRLVRNSQIARLLLRAVRASAGPPTGTAAPTTERARGRDHRPAGRCHQPRRRPHPSQLPRHDPGHRAHERLQGRRHAATSRSSSPARTFRSMPAPVPLWEIFVYSPEMEGVHLRGGMVARGGIRWSDRLEDYRTEILGLMKAQMVKNAVIVPIGAKGGFVLKRPPADRDELQRGGAPPVHHADARHARPDRQHRRRRGRATRPGVRVLDGDRPVPGRGGRQGHRPPVRHRQRGQRRVRLLAGRRLRLRRVGRLRPQGARHHRQRRLGERQAPLPRAGPGRGVRAVHRRRHRRHVRRRVRQRHAAVAADPAGRRAFDHRHIFIDPDPDPARRSTSGGGCSSCRQLSWDDYDRVADLGRRRRLAALGQVGAAVRRGARGARRRRRAADADRADARRSCARRSTCSGTAASARS